MFDNLLTQAVAGILDRCDPEATLTREEVELYLLTASEDRNYDYGVDGDEPRWYGVAALVSLAPVLIEKLCFDERHMEALEQSATLFENLRHICFVDCEFHLNHLPDYRYMVRFQFKSCKFFSEFEASLEISDGFNALFIGCQFFSDVKLVWGDLAKNATMKAIFIDCLLRNVVVDGVRLDVQLFDFSAEQKPCLEKLVIDNCSVIEDLDVSDFKLGELVIRDSAFKGALKAKSVVLDKFVAESSKFKSIVDFEGATVCAMSFERCMLTNVLNLESVRFERGSKKNIAEDMQSIVGFRFCTFDKMINFRNVRFGIALDLRLSNRKELPNFLGAVFKRAARKKTDRETFRIIKNSFEAVGNHVEANEYFAMEMEAYRLELKGRFDKLSERFLLTCNYWMSKHGQSYLLPLFWIALLMFVFQGVRYGFEQNRLYLLFPDIEQFVSAMNAWASSLIIFKPLMGEEGLEFVSLLFGVLFSTLVWQTLSAIRRHMRK